MNNPLFDLLKSNGLKLGKKKWPKLSNDDMLRMEIKPRFVWNHSHPACLSETMGPNWKYGFFLNGRPYAFNEVGNYYRGGKYNG